jgi:hypothetical protein
MSFIDSVKHIEQLAVIDEFGGRGSPDKIRRFYIILRVMDDNGELFEITSGDIRDAVNAEQLVLADYMGFNKIPLADNENGDFMYVGAIYKDGTNFIVVDPIKYTGNISICVKILKEKGGDILASTCYLSDFPSTFHLSKKS